MNDKNTVEQTINDPMTHEHLLSIVKELPEDYKPFGKRRHGDNDCSCGCKFYAKLAHADLWGDWGVCTNLVSHRVGLLTFEHQGCKHFYNEDWDKPIVRNVKLEEALSLLSQRTTAMTNGDTQRADELLNTIQSMGYSVADTANGAMLSEAK